MKELVVCSGKGGTGKTSLVASFAALASNSVLADCDVDAADLHLIMASEVEQRQAFMSGRKAVIQADRCLGCGVCRDFCRFDAIELRPGPDGNNLFSVDALSCEGCGVCVHFCPEQAIDFPESLCGEWYIRETVHGPLVGARLEIGAENSGKLVALVRGQAQRLTRERQLELLLVDGPPGIGCPVIAALTGANLVLVVTEPTLSGLHDLERVVSLAEHFQLPVCVCINKYDINPGMAARIDSFCRDRDLRVVGMIPYDPAVTAAQITGWSVVEQGRSPAVAAIRETWDEVQQCLEQ